MHKTSLLFALGLLAPLCPAQSTNLFQIYPERTGACTTHVTRMSLAGNAGEVLKEVPATLLRGVGNNGTACRVIGMRIRTADEDGSTAETYHLVFRRAAPGGGPDPTPAGVIARFGPFQTQTSAGRVGWDITHTFAQPVTIPCEADFYHGFELTQANWTADGQSIYTAYYYPTPPSPTVGDNPRGNALSLGWTVDPVGQFASRGVPGQNPWFDLLLDTPVLNMGGVDPNNVKQSPAGSPCFGAGGLYPDVSGGSRSDGLVARVTDAGNTNGRGYVFLSANWLVFAGGLPVPGVTGRLWTDPTIFLLAGQGNLVGSEATFPIAPAGAINASLVGATVYFQALTVNASLGNLRLSNAAGVSL
ncbi:MAG: hypothetical protein IT458_17760 [Planctomycetes bacterium]|nr:hypothetical protein [Planctomycetota bacterium]